MHPRHERRPTRRGGAVLAIASLLAAGTFAASPARPAASQAGPQGSRQTIPGSVVSFEMVPVPGGTVTLDGQAVEVAPFLIGRTEATWDMYDLFAASEPADEAVDALARPSQPYGAPDYDFGHNGYPVISVTRSGAEAFCAWLSAKTGTAYRLPTEAEWQHAARLAAGGGDTLPDRNAIAWHAGNARGTTHPVGKRKRDALGLFDLFGNAAEWVATADGTLVTRGGSFRDPPDAVGPAARAVQDPSWNERDPQLPKSTWWLSDAPFAGFRIATSGT